MYNFNVTGVKRKNLVQTLSHLTGESSKYLAMPSCAFQVGNWTVGKNGEVSGPQLSEELLAGLAKAGFTATEGEAGLIIHVPRDSHLTDQAATAFLNMVNSKRPLIRAAFGLQNFLPVDVTDDEIIVKWFETELPDDEKAARALIEAMIKKAKTCQRVDPTPVRSDNPKFSFRVFLNSLGLTGVEHKAVRKELLKNLEGSSAWRHGSPA